MSVCATDAVTREDFLFSTVKTDTLSNSSWNICSHPPSCPEASLQENPPWQKLANGNTEADAQAGIQLQSLELQALETKLNPCSCPRNVSLQCYIITASLVWWDYIPTTIMNTRFAPMSLQKMHWSKPLQSYNIHSRCGKVV